MVYYEHSCVCYLLLTTVWCVLGSFAMHSRAGVSGGHFTAREDGAVEQNRVYLSGTHTHTLTDASINES